MSYCKAIKSMTPERAAIHGAYHDAHYGFPIHDDDELFCRLILEINQAGLSWETILKKEKTFRKAYSGFQLRKVAKYTDKDRARLMGDPGIIRNNLKVNAAIENAKTILMLQKEHGSFGKWLESHHPKTKDEWVKIFKKTRRQGYRRTNGHRQPESVLRVADLELDRMTHTVRRAGEEIPLKPQEYRVLEFLMRHAGQVVTRTMLLEGVWDYHFDPQTNVIDVHISRLRTKIDRGFDPPLLHTVRGSGYMIRAGGA